MKVQAKKTKTAPVKAVKKPVAKPLAKAKPVLKSKPAVKAKAVAKGKPLAKVKPVVQAKVVAKAQPAPKGKVAVKAVPAKKAAAKPVAKSKAVAPKKVAKPAAKKLVKAPVKAPVKALAKAQTKPSGKASQAAKNAKTLVKAAVQAVVKTVAKVAAKSATKTPAKLPVKAAPTPVAAVPSAPVVAVPLPPGTVVQKGGRPSARLQQITVPSMAQSVASTAAKASFTKDLPPLFTPPPMVAPKKDPKLANNWKTKPAEKLTDAELLAMPDSEYMNEKQMAAFRLKLVELKNGILSSASETTEHLRDDTVVVPDPADRATIEEEHALELRTRDRERKLLKKIEQSINRIDAGDYGYCDETGEVIGVGRLIARPTATLTLEAQQRRELKQKMFGD